MNIRNFYFTAFVVLFFITAPSVSYGANLIPNGSLETGTTLPTGWEKIKGAAANVVSFSYPAPASDGAKGARIIVSAYSKGDVFWLPPTAPVQASTEYIWSGDSMNTRPVTIVATYVVGTGAQYETLGTVGTSTGWTTFTKKFKTPAGATGVRVQHLIKGVGTITVDNYRLDIATATTSATTTPPVASTTPPIATTTPPTATSTPPIATTTPPIATSTPTTTPPIVPPPTNNLITNGDFEQGATTPTGWSGDYWGNMRAQFTYPVPGASGNAAKVTVTSHSSGDAKWYFVPISVSDSKIFTYSEKYLASVPTSLNAEFTFPDGSTTYVWLKDLQASASFQPFSVEVTVPPQATKVSVFHAIDKVGSLTIDDVSLTEITAATFAGGMLTIVFDDGLASVYANARAILQSAAVPVTHAVITQFVGTGGYMTWPQLAEFAAMGHEIDSHTRTHPDLTSLSSTQLTSEISGSRSDLVVHGYTPQTLVYPLGAVNDAVKAAVVSAGYTAARGSYSGLNTTKTDRYQLADIHVESNTPVAEIDSWIAQAVRDKRWLILELHDQLASGSIYSNSPATLQAIIAAGKARGIQFVTLQQGAAQLQ